MRTIFIGDIHGCYDELIALCEKVKLQPEDHLYLVGDMINKGPKSVEVVDFVRSRPNTFPIIGNHELFLLGCALTESTPENKKWIEIEYEKARSVRESLITAGHRDWLLALPHIIERESFIVVHGGLHPDFGLQTPREVATMIRLLNNGNPWYESYTGKKPIIYGHWAVDGLRIRPNTIGLDTGCCFGGHLTAYCIETGEYWQVRANNVYKEPANWREK